MKRKINDLDHQKADSGITEQQVGITEYVFKGQDRVSGLLKQRYTDFLVNEIDLDGNVVHLNDLGFPEQEEKQSESEKKGVFEISDEQRSELEEIIGKSDVDKVLQIFSTGDKMVTEKTFESKEDRTKLHRLLRTIFRNRLESLTLETNHFQIGLGSKNSKRRVVIEHNLGERKRYLYANLYKENKETMEVAGLLAKFLNIPVKNIKYAGTKDRRGVTVQKISIERISVERINNLNKALRGFQIGGFSYADQPLNLGDLQGNEFIITIKDISLADGSTDIPSLQTKLDPVFDSMKKYGYINYFGMQRFGTFSVSTHEVGKYILQSEWKQAAELILSEQEVVLPDSVEARKIWKETKNPGDALKKMPRRCSAEFSILSRLEHDKKQDDREYSANSYFKAIMGIPRNLRIMYGHAYQSYVWNTVASARVQLFGPTVVVGDLVIDDSELVEKDEDFEEDIKQETFVRAKPVTQEDVDQKRYTIHDIVLPTPGFDVRYPENSQLRQTYVDVMSKDGLDPFKMSRRVREFSLAGSYRHVFAQVKGLEYSFRHYESNLDSLVYTDLELLRLREEGKQVERLKEATEGPKVALVVKMQLGVSAYATMALREFLDGQQ
ncbi:hypothetical protein OGAPHI_001926 [Ogataea philodendri]|uniref:TRUD domain-containing protein n=1 Tax=Ogataea philodendri TaxID=1378263 RepID=A0A9P8PB91_9ASCO|nr:uncharacterized protein OGAPHI_001926 [Ogataea philodendri]KAH3668172.1 hypothetical protein OGAPHI_001926 [Ogataea philodendri]